jgi:hypothetical protein
LLAGGRNHCWCGFVAHQLAARCGVAFGHHIFSFWVVFHNVFLFINSRWALACSGFYMALVRLFPAAKLEQRIGVCKCSLLKKRKWLKIFLEMMRCMIKKLSLELIFFEIF